MKGHPMSDKADGANSEAHSRRRPEVTEEEARRQFIQRLSDWSEPGAVTVIRNGVPLRDQTVLVKNLTTKTGEHDDSSGDESKCSAPN